MFSRMRLALACAVFGLAGFLAVPSAEALVPPPKGPIVGPGKLNHYHVMYRMPTARERIFTNQFQAIAFASKLKSLGFVVRLTPHVGHFHVRYELDFWRQKTFYGTLGHGQAHSLENWLKSIGCQTKLIHH